MAGTIPHNPVTSESILQPRRRPSEDPRRLGSMSSGRGGKRFSSSTDPNRAMPGIRRLRVSIRRVASSFRRNRPKTDEERVFNFLL